MMIAAHRLDRRQLVADNRIEVGIVIADMAVYLLIDIGCLRCTVGLPQP